MKPWVKYSETETCGIFPQSRKNNIEVRVFKNRIVEKDPECGIGEWWLKDGQWTCPGLGAAGEQDQELLTKLYNELRMP